MKELLKELGAASAKLQAAHGIARSAGRGDIAAEIVKTATAVSTLIGKLVTARPVVAPEVVS